MKQSPKRQQHHRRVYMYTHTHIHTSSLQWVLSGTPTPINLAPFCGVFQRCWETRSLQRRVNSWPVASQHASLILRLCNLATPGTHQTHQTQPKPGNDHCLWLFRGIISLVICSIFEREVIPSARMLFDGP